MAKRTTTARTKKDIAPVAASVGNVATKDVSAEGKAPEKLYSNEQKATSIAGENQTTFEFRFWELGELQGKVQGVEVGHDGAPVDLFVFDEANFEAFKTGQQHQYIGGFGITAARHLFQIPFDGTWYLAVRPVKAEDEYEVAYRLMNFN